MRVCSLSKQLAEAEAQRDRALQLQKRLAESKEGDGAVMGWVSLSWVLHRSIAASL